jgi:Flp pilus assembly protein TadG
MAPLVRLLRREEGGAAVGLVLMLPMFLYVFMAAFEIGLYMTRLTLLDRAVDITARDIRLGNLVNPDADDIKESICQNASIVPDCLNAIRLSLEKVETTTWTMPATETKCFDRATDPLKIVSTLDTDPTERKALMIMRGCLHADALFPSIGVAVALPLDGTGGYRLAAVAAFLTEP